MHRTQFTFLLSLGFLCLPILPLDAWGQENQETKAPTNVKLELLVITRQLERSDTAKKTIVPQVEETIAEHREASLSEIQDALDRQIRKELGKQEVCNLEAFRLNTYDDLEQWVKFGTTQPRVFSGQSSAERQRPPVVFGETKVLATPWIIRDGKIRLGVTVERIFPRSFPGDARPGQTVQFNGNFSYTSNTVVESGQAVVVNSYRHVGDGVTTELIVVGRATE